MPDFTSEIANLQRRRIEMQTAKKVAEIEVKEKYAARIREEIKRRTEEAELEFAREIADAHARGVPQSLIRSDVLRTNVWSRWTYWRDLAQIEPDRVVVQNKREAQRQATNPFRWDLSNPGSPVLTVVRNPAGAEIEPIPVEIVRASDWATRGAPVTAGVEMGFTKGVDAFGGVRELDKIILAEVTRAFEAGEIPEILDPYEVEMRRRAAEGDGLG